MPQSLIIVSMSFKSNTSIAPLPKEDLWITTAPLSYYFSDTLEWDYIEVPKWFKFNWVTVPRVFWWLIPPVEPRTINCACLHDWLWKNGYWWRKSNAIYFDTLEIMDVRSWKRILMCIWLTPSYPYYLLIQRKNNG